MLNLIAVVENLLIYYQKGILLVKQYEIGKNMLILQKPYHHLLT